MKILPFSFAGLFLFGLSCARREAPFQIGEEVRGVIRAGQKIQLGFAIPAGFVGNVLVHQHEIDLAVEAGGVKHNSTEWDYESVYVGGQNNRNVIVTLVAELNGPRSGVYRARLVEISPDSKQTALGIKAQRLDAEARALLLERTAKSIPLAEQKLQQACDAWRKFGETRRLGFCLLALGVSRERQSHYGGAEAAYVEAMKLIEVTGDRSAFLYARKTWANLGGRIGEERSTIDNLKGMLADSRAIGDHRMVAMFTQSLASAFGRARQYKQDRELKLQHLNLVRGLGDKSRECESLDRISALELTVGRYNEALQYAHEAELLAREVGDIGAEISALGMVAASLNILKRNDEAVQVLSRLRELQIKRGDFGAWIVSSERLGEFYRQMGKPEFAWSVYEGMQAPLMKHYQTVGEVGAAFSSPGQNGTDFLVARLLENSHQFDERTFWYTDSQRGRFLVPAPASSTKELQSNLGPDVALVEFIASRDSLLPGYGWIVTAKSIESFRTAPIAPIPDELPIEAKVLDLSRNLLVPLKGKLRERHVVVVPDETMAGIPFGLLVDPDQNDGSRLGDHHVVTYAPSGQFFLSSKSSRRGMNDLRVMIAGDPVTNLRDTRLLAKATSAPPEGEWTSTARSAGLLKQGTQLPRLAFATREVERIETILRGKSVRKLTGFDASRSRVMDELERAGIAHLVSHGFVDLQKVKGSGLAFSFWDREGKPVDGILRFDEIARMKLNAELVTLAACESAIGKVLSHNGVPSLANAFLKAGAKRVVSTLWKVDDAATVELMGEFYRQLFGPVKMSPGEALWRAQMHVARQPKWSKPYYWAGFVLSGDWRPI